MPRIIQLFEPNSSTYTYVVFDPSSLEGVIIDPVDNMLQRDLQTLASLNVRLKYVIETHTHADHITSAAALAEHTGAQVATPAGCGSQAAHLLENGDTLNFGCLHLKAIHTPGHTAGSMSYCLESSGEQQLFTGDTLLINGCGRTDFQSGSAQSLYHSITQVLFQFPDATIVWPGHDYNGNTQTTIGAQRTNNPRLVQNGKLISESQFVTIMNGLHLPAPKRMHEAVPANLHLGLKSSVIHEVGISAHSQVPYPAQGYAGDISPELAWHWVQTEQAVLIDVRSDAERAWVGFVPDAKIAAWKLWPGMLENPEFDAQLRSAAQPSKKLLLLCRSGLRSIPAAKRASLLGFEAYNILEGFEGDPNPHAHRNTVGGWRVKGLPWKQN